MPKKDKLALKLEINTYQILTNDDKVCITSLSSILLAVPVSASYVSEEVLYWTMLAQFERCHLS